MWWFVAVLHGCRRLVWWFVAVLLGCRRLVWWFVTVLHGCRRLVWWFVTVLLHCRRLVGWFMVISKSVSGEKHHCEKQQKQVFGRHFGLFKDLELWCKNLRNLMAFYNGLGPMFACHMVYM